MRHPHGETVGIRSYTGSLPDSHGNSIDTWAAAVDYPGCAIAPASSTESPADQSDATTTVLTVYGPPELTAKPRDLAVYRGLEWTIDGEPERWQNPFTGDNPGCVLTIRRSEV